MTTQSAANTLVVFASILVGSAQEVRNPVGPQAGSSAGSLRQIIPGHYAYSTTNAAGRVFSSGVIVTSEGALVVDALDSEAIARAERESISSIIKQPVRYLVSSSFHDPFSKGNIAYADVFKIGHENYRAGLLDQMERGGASAEERAGEAAERDVSRSRDHLRWRQGDSGSLFRPGPHAGRQHRLRPAGPDCVSERSVLFRGISEHGAGLRRLVAAGAGRGGGARGRCLRAGPWSHSRRSQRTLERSCTACGSYLSTHETRSRMRLREGPPKIRLSPR